MTELSDGVNFSTCSRPAHIVDCEAVVAQDGDHSRITLKEPTGRSHVFDIGIDRMGEIVAEMQTAMRWMINCQMQKLDSGEHKIDEICRAADFPLTLRFVHLGGDEYALAFQTNNHAPIALRLRMVEVLYLQIQIKNALRTAIN